MNAHTLPLVDYGLVDAVVSPLPGGTINDVYKVESHLGLFVLKEYSGLAMDAEHLQRICEAMELLREAGLPVPAVVPARDSRRYAVKDERYFLLTEHMSGQTIAGAEMSEIAALQLGVMHARMLDVLRRLPGGGPLELPGPEEIGSRLQALHDLASKRRSSNVVDEMACLMLEQKLRILDAWQGPPPSLPSQWTHGDYTWRNVLFDDQDQVVAIFDFDNLRFHLCARDVIRCFTLSFPHGSDQGLSYFRGYAQTAKLSPQDVREYVQAYRYLFTYSTWPAAPRYSQTEPYQARWDEFLRPQPVEWETGWDQLAEQLAAIAEVAVRA